MNNNNLKNILLIFFICLSVSLGVYIICDKCIEKKSSVVEEKIIDNNKEYIDTFDSNEVGKVLVKGYATIEKIKENCYSEEECLNAKSHDYVMFHIVDTKSENFRNFISAGQGNYYIGSDSIAIGCISNNVISYSNAENQKFITHTLTEEDTKIIMDSTKNNRPNNISKEQEEEMKRQELRNKEREIRQAKIREKMEKEAKMKMEIMKKASEYMTQFYEERQKRIAMNHEKLMQGNGSQNNNNNINSGSPWGMVESSFTGSSSNADRMKEAILNRNRQEK